MKIALINASSQAAKNQSLFTIAKHVLEPQGHTVLNLGVSPSEHETYSYVDVALEIAVLLNSHAVDFVLTGCSSGNGMQLACNSFPGVICGYASQPTEAALFGMINDGNVLSFPLGYQFGWAGELTFESVVEKLFAQPMGTGYPADQAARKRRDTKLVKELRQLNFKPFQECLDNLPHDFVEHALSRPAFLATLHGFGEVQFEF